MTKRRKGLNSARGFGNQEILPDEELLVLNLITKLALNLASERLSEFDPTKAKAEWHDWLMEEASQRLSEVESEEELEAIFLDEFE
jgi:hypothetical protein